MISNNTKIILTLFAYLPLFAVIAIRNLDFLHNIFLNYIDIDVPKIRLFIAVIIFFVCLYYLFKRLVGRILGRIDSQVPREVEVQIKSEKNTEMLGFLLTYVVPFCITFENGLYDLFAFCLLFALILYAYIKTSLFCINPLLNYSFGYNIYEIEMHNMDGFMLTTKRHRNVSKYVKIYKITDNLWKEK
ncbi:MAG: hypothetical protein QG646_3475 [Euryarchaeota archaeon]|nr:hypothetical protein [Euryarchaeota archaeon]